MFMSICAKPLGYYTGCNTALLQAVPASAKRILEVGCAEGNLGAALMELDPLRRVFGIEREPLAAARAAKKLNRVFTLDIERGDPDLEPASLDCILYGDVLEHLVDPEAVLRRHRQLLHPDGTIICSVPNVQHHSVITALLQSDFQYTTAGLLDVTHLRFFTYSTLIKLLLDAGYAPSLIADIAVPAPGRLAAALIPALHELGLHPARTQRYLNAYQYIAQGSPLGWEAERRRGSEEALSFVVCVSDEARLSANLLSSPCLLAGSPHEVIALRHCPSAAEGLNEGLRRANNRLVICVHQDVYLPRGWPERFLDQYRRAEVLFGPIGVAGVYGIARGAAGPCRAGRVVDRDRLLAEEAPLPASVDTLDELLVAIPRGTPMKFDSRLGFHLYATDLCLQAHKRGLATVALDAMCFHNSLGVGLPEEFLRGASILRSKWGARLPIVTPCACISADGQLQIS
jgi:SAM-dependent methyltransferase